MQDIINRAAMKKYIFRLLFSLISVLLFIALINWVVNPFGIFTSPDIEGVNVNKSEIERYTRLTKVYQVYNKSFDMVLLASSRGLIIPDDNPLSSGYQMINLSLPSGSTYEQFRMLQHAMAIQPLKRILLGLDEAFTLHAEQNFEEGRLAVDPDSGVNTRRWVFAFKDKLNSLIGLDATRASVRTMRHQNNKTGNIDERVINAGGNRNMFLKLESSMLGGYQGVKHHCDSVSAESMAHQPPAMRYFRKMLELAYRNNIDMYIYISPVHARYYEIECMTGKWPMIENMKRAVVSLVSSLAVKYKKTAFPVWDFSGYNSITTENLPEKDDTRHLMSWYLEDSHFSKKTAMIITARMAGSLSIDTYPDFGVQITTDTIEDHLLSIHAGRKQYLATHKQDIQELDNLFERIVER